MTERISQSEKFKALSRGEAGVKRHVILAGLLTVACPLKAASGPVSTILGVGTQSCGTWLKDESSEADGKSMNHSWLAGFVTAYNATGIGGTHNASSGTDFAGLTRWISNYCAAHPLDSIAVASGALVNELRRRQVRR